MPGDEAAPSCKRPRSKETCGPGSEGPGGPCGSEALALSLSHGQEFRGPRVTKVTPAQMPGFWIPLSTRGLPCLL